MWLAIGVAASGAVLLVLGSHLTFMLDDWAFLQLRGDPSWTAVMSPHNEHIAITPVLIYEGLLHMFGMQSSFPFRVVATAMFLASVVLLFIWLRRRVGGWLALLAAMPILFYGAAAEDLLFPFQVGFFGSVAFGLAALLALDRDDRFGDRLACLLLTLAMTFSSVGLPLLIGVAVIIFWDDRRWARIYVIAVPVFLYALWWLGWGHEAESNFVLSQVATGASYVLDGLAAVSSSYMGLSTPRSDATITALDLGRPLLLALLALAVWRVHRLGRPTRWLCATTAIALSFWLLASFNADIPARGPAADRYLYVGAVFALLIVGELLSGVRITRRMIMIAAAIATVGVIGNLGSLRLNYRSLKSTTELERADLAALEIARDVADPQFQIAEDIGDTPYVGVQGQFYFPAADQFGSPAFDESELVASSEAARTAADKVLAAALRLRAEPLSMPPSPSVGAPPSLVGSSRPGVVTDRNCLRLPRPGAGPTVLSLQPGGLAVGSDHGSSATLSIRRFASGSYPIGVGTVPATGGLRLSIPTDRSSRRWEVAIDADGPTIACTVNP